MLKMPETIVCGDIGLVLLSGLGSRRTHPVGAEGATMARRAPFPLSSIPAYIDQSMKLIVCTFSAFCANGEHFVHTEQIRNLIYYHVQGTLSPEFQPL